MAKIPTAESFGPHPTPEGTGFIAKPPMPQTSGTDFLASSLNVMGERLQKVQDENDKTHAEAAYNELIKKRQDLTVGQEGFVHKQGQDALSQPLMKDYGDLLQKSEDEISSKLQNDQQRKMFKERADVASLQFRQDILNHVVKEQDAYATQTFKDTIQTETNNAANRYRDPNAINMSIVRMENAINTQAERQGWSKETKQAAMTEVKSGAYRGVIERMLSNGQDLDAKNYYETLKQKKDTFTAKDRIAIEKSLHVGSIKGESQRRADKLVAENQDDLKNALDQARQIKDPELRDATVSRVKGHIADNETAIRLNHDEAFTHAYQVVEQTGSTGNIEPKYQVLLSRTDMNYLDLRASEIRDNRVPEQNPKVWEDFNYASRDYKVLAGMSDADFFGKYWVNFDDAHRKRAVSLREAARQAEANDPSAQTKLEDHVTFETRMFDTLHRLNIIPYGKTAKDVKDLSDEDRTLIGNFRQEADAQIREYQVAHGLKYVDGDTKQKIMDNLALHKYMKVNVERPWPLWDASGVPASQLTPEQKRLAYIPMDQISPISQEKIFNFAKSEGIIPRDMPMSRFLDNYRDRIQRAKYADIEGADPNQIVKILRGQ